MKKQNICIDCGSRPDGPMESVCQSCWAKRRDAEGEWLALSTLGRDIKTGKKKSSARSEIDRSAPVKQSAGDRAAAAKVAKKRERAATHGEKDKSYRTIQIGKGTTRPATKVRALSVPAVGNLPDWLDSEQDRRDYEDYFQWKRSIESLRGEMA